MDLQAAKSFIISELEQKLNPGYVYHSLKHTLDVHGSAVTLAGMEEISRADMDLLETAALFHDSGMIITYRDHEQASADLARKYLPGFGFSASQIETISGLIMATRLPQQASGILEQIICDADLDYLGREDFFVHSMELQQEWNHFGILKTDLSAWLDIQIKFLGSHNYFTRSAILLRNRKKTENLNEIKSLWQQKNQKNPSTTASS
jgi:hypothetical protein